MGIQITSRWVRNEYNWFKFFRWKCEKQGKKWVDWFGNFHLYMPGNAWRGYFQESYGKDIPKDGRHSDLAKTEIYNQFFRVLDDVLKIEGIYEEILELNNFEGIGLREKICKKVIKIYFKMRDRGYNRYDLGC